MKPAVIHLDVCISLYVCVNVCAYLGVCVNVCAYVGVCICTCIACMPGNAHVCVCVCVYERMPAHMHCIHAYAHVYLCYIREHVCDLVYCKYWDIAFDLLRSECHGALTH
jgi:hypothetical protein